MPIHSAATKPHKNPLKRKQFWIAISGALGGMLAILADLLQKEQASAVMKLHDVLHEGLLVSVPPLIVMVLLVGAATALCFVFAVESTKSAFYRGASILAFVMVVTPYKVPPGIPTEADQPQPSGASLEWHLTPSVFAQTSAPAKSTFRIDVHLTASDGKKIPSAIYTLTDPATGGVIARSNVQGNTFSFYVSNRSYRLRVEVPSYRIVDRQLTVNSPQSLTIALSPTRWPLLMQRVVR